MEYPTLYVKEKSRQMVEVFNGYNHNLRIGDGEFFDMKNMTSDYYPVLAPRGRRGVYKDGVRANGLIAKDALCYVDGSKFVINEYEVDMGLNDEPKQLISMGAYVIVMPDRKWINTKNLEHGNIDSEFASESLVRFSMCKQDGIDYETIYSEEPQKPKNGDLWIDTSSDPNALKQWSDTSEMWVTIATTYVKISCPGIDEAFEKYDGITISGLSGVLTDENGNVLSDTSDLAALEGSAVVWEKGEGFIVVVGLLEKAKTISESITFSRKMPAMDFIIESGNRLFGCKYGESNNGEIVNEIYASKLGDFKNWNCFMGVSTDSYVASCGTDGQFTGAITHMGYPLFFKENCVHKVYGNYPANFKIQDTACNGVQNGCGNSLAIVNTTLLYKSRGGVFACDGSIPTEISYALGNKAYKNAVGGAHDNKYYISMEDENGASNLFVYDAAKGMWHKEDDLKVDAFCSCNGEMYAISGGKVITMLGSGDAGENAVEWMAETGEIGMNSPDMKYISRLTLRMAMDIGAEMAVYAQYDFSSRWELVCRIKGTSLRSFSIPVRPKRCDNMKLRIEGIGNAKIYSITKTIEQGSEIS